MQSHMFARSLFCLLIPALFVSSGCNSASDELRRYGVTGTVTYQGKPVPYGEIQFIPDSTEQNSAPGAVTVIVDGKYKLDRSKGVIGGAHSVLVTGYTAPPFNGGVPPEGTPESLPLFPPHKTSHDFPKSDSEYDIAVP